MVKPKDYQRQKLYNAERHAFRFDRGGTVILKACELLVEEVEDSDLWADLCRVSEVVPRKVRVKDGRGRRSACASYLSMSISLPRWSRKDWIVLHELAHLATAGPMTYQARINYPEDIMSWQEVRAGHGPEFAGIYLELVGGFKSPADKARLRSAYFEYGVDWIDPFELEREEAA